MSKSQRCIVLPRTERIQIWPKLLPVRFEHFRPHSDSGSTAPEWLGLPRDGGKLPDRDPPKRQNRKKSFKPPFLCSCANQVYILCSPPPMSRKRCPAQVFVLIASLSKFWRRREADQEGVTCSHRQCLRAGLCHYRELPSTQNSNALWPLTRMDRVPTGLSEQTQDNKVHSRETDFIVLVFPDYQNDELISSFDERAAFVHQRDRVSWRQKAVSFLIIH